MVDPAEFSAQAGQRQGSGVHKLRGGVSKKKNKKRTGSLAHHIRGIERLLAKMGDDMAPAARRGKEAELESCRALQRDRTRRSKEKDIAAKYRMVKFFEKRKIERQLKKVRGKTDEKSNEKREQLQRDLRYVVEYPKDCKYVALFPSGGHTELSKQKVDDMRKRIESANEIEVAVHGAKEDDDVGGAAQSGGEIDEDDFFLADEDDAK